MVARAIPDGGRASPRHTGSAKDALGVRAGGSNRTRLAAPSSSLTRCSAVTRRSGALAASATVVVAGLNADPYAADCGNPAGSTAQNNTVSTVTHAAAPVRQSRDRHASCDWRALKHMVVKERAMSRKV